MQCAMGAMTAGAAATGARSYLAATSPAWLSRERLRALTIALIVAGVVTAAAFLG